TRPRPPIDRALVPHLSGSHAFVQPVKRSIRFVSSDDVVATPAIPSVSDDAGSDSVQFLGAIECVVVIRSAMNSARITIPLLDLRAQYHNIKPEIDQAIAGVLESSQFVLGAEVAAFEKEFAAYCSTAECIALNSGTSAIHLALLAAGGGPDDEVVTVPFTFVASVAAVLYTGGRPVLVDVEPRSFTMDPAAIEAAITPRTKAILPVH